MITGMQSAVEYLVMDGYWPFIWSAYGFAAAVLIALLVASLRAVNANERAIAAFEPRRRRRGSADASDDA